MFFNSSLLSLTILINYHYITVSGSETEILGSLHRIRRQLLYPNSTLLQFNAGMGFPSAAKNINVNYAFQANFQLPWNRTQIPVDILDANSGYKGPSRKKRDLGTGEIAAYYQDDAKLYHFYKHVEDVLNSFGHNGKVCVLHTLCQLGAEPLHSDDEEDLLHEIASFVLKDRTHLSDHWPTVVDVIGHGKSVCLFKFDHSYLKQCEDSNSNMSHLEHLNQLNSSTVGSPTDFVSRIRSFCKTEPERMQGLWLVTLCWSNPTHDAKEDMTEKDEAFPYIAAYTNGQKNRNCNKLYQGCSFSFVDIFTKLHDTS